MAFSFRQTTFADRRWQLLALMLPAVLGLSQLLWGSSITPLAKVPTLPGLSFDQYLVDLREIGPAEEVYGYFRFRNSALVPLTITKLEPSCGCLQPRLTKTVFLPGESGEFRLRVKTVLQQPGPKEFTVKVHYTDSVPRTRDVFLRVTFPEQQIYVRPMSLTFHQFGTSPIEQEIVVTDLRRSPAEVLGSASSSDFLQVQVLETSTTETGARQQRLKVTIPGAVPAGRHIGTVKIYTDDPTFQEFRVPFQVYGPEKKGPGIQMASPHLIGPSRR